MKILAVGNAIIDLLCNVENEFLEFQQLQKNSMSLISSDTIDYFLKLKAEKICAGGSVANSIATIAALGGDCKFFGSVGDNHLGKKFISECNNSGTEYIGKIISNAHSATSFVLITPDSMRTMCTYLGCASKIEEKDFSANTITDIDLVYLEGYLWDNEDTIFALKKLIKLSKENNKKIALTLSDSFCVNRHRDDFLGLIKNDIDILFANEEEIKSLIQSNDFKKDEIEKILSINPKLVAAITRSEKGCVIFSKDYSSHLINTTDILISQNEKNNKLLSIEIPAFKINNIIDTTGAGDNFAAGFLLGLVKKFNLEKSAKLGNFLASKIIQKIGGRFNSEEISPINQLLKNHGFVDNI
jgi:fructokinase